MRESMVDSEITFKNNFHRLKPQICKERGVLVLHSDRVIRHHYYLGLFHRYAIHVIVFSNLNQTLVVLKRGVL